MSLYGQTMSRLRYLREELNLEVRVIWECEFRNRLREEPHLQILSEELDLLPRLDPRQSFYGGRTNAMKLYHEAKNGKKIGYVDICSLYPMVLKNDVFHVGIPEVICNPEGTDISQYFGTDISQYFFREDYTIRVYPSGVTGNSCSLFALSVPEKTH